MVTSSQCGQREEFGPEAPHMWGDSSSTHLSLLLKFYMNLLGEVIHQFGDQYHQYANDVLHFNIRLTGTSVDLPTQGLENG